MGSICIVTGSHLCHNPRVIKEAVTLAESGHQVEVIGGWFDETLKSRDKDMLDRIPNVKFTPVLDLTAPNKVGRLICRVRTKTGQMVHLRSGLENTWQLGYFAPALRGAASRSRADLLVAHSESSMAAVAAATRNGRRIGVDMEDWFSEDHAPEAKKYRPVKLLRFLEQSLLAGAYRTCTSRAMSHALASEFNCPPPTVIYNAFEWCERQSLDRQFKDRKNLQAPSIHWYSQTLGHGRGLEDLFAALPHVAHHAEIHLRGNPVAGFDQWLYAHVPRDWQSKVFIHGLVKNDELLSRIAEHDIGFAGERPYCRNKDLTVSNKILHYLLAGLAVVASDTAGQKEVAAQADGAVKIYPSGDPVALAKQLNELLGSANTLKTAKAAALIAAEQTFCWERQVPRLLESVERALST
jgi:glycosyltransferase involved in cell wall biosynthesis